MRFIVLCGAVVALAGCVSAKPIPLPSGAQGYLITCNTEANDIGDCYKKAAETCHGPYDIVERSESSQAYYSATPVMGTGGSIPKRSLMIQCR